MCSSYNKLKKLRSTTFVWNIYKYNDYLAKYKEKSLLTLFSVVLVLVLGKLSRYTPWSLLGGEEV
jgi:hypothetical protein